MKNKRNGGWIKFEFINFWRSKKFKWIIGAGIQFFIVSIFLQENKLTGEDSSLSGLWIMSFVGIREYVKSQDGRFEIPVLWMLFQAYILFMVCDYISEGMSGYGVLAFIRTKNRKKWIAVKTLTGFVAVIFYYIQYFCIMSGAIWLSGGSWSSGFQNSFHTFSYRLTITILPLVMTIALFMLQNMLCIITVPFIAYMISLGILIVSAYIQSPFLIGNYAMLLRNSIFSENGLSTGLGLVICGLVMVTVLLLSMIYITHYDVVEKGLEERWK